MRVLIIADDLTGALDSACAFAARGLRTRAVLDTGRLSAALADPALAVVALATGTRERPAEEAAAAIRAAMDGAKGFHGAVFKKIDSRLKGNIAAELAALRSYRPEPVLCSPAIPKLGRLVRDGAVVGAGVTDPLPIAPVVGAEALIPDIASDEALDMALPRVVSENLYVGAAGLAEALARRLAPGAPVLVEKIAAPLLLAIGSRDPVTLAQVAAAGVAPLPAPNGRVPDLPPARVSLVQMSPGDSPVAGAVAARAFASGIAAQMRQSPPRTLFACGGETAHAILRALGIETLDLQGEALAGIAVARDPASGLSLITKSGGFGAPETLRILLDKIEEAPR